MKRFSFKGLVALPILSVAILATSCEKDNDDVQAKSNVNVVHASPKAPGVDLYVDNTKVNSSALVYPNNTGYLQVNAGTRNIKVNATGTSTTVINANVPFAENKNYSVFAYDVATSIKPLVVEDNLTAPAAGKAHVRFLHLSPNAPAVTVGILAGNTFTGVFNNRSFETQSTATANQSFSPVDAATYTFQVRLASDNSVVLTLPNISLQAGKIYTIFARGLVADASAPLGAEIIVHN